MFLFRCNCVRLIVTTEYIYYQEDRPISLGRCRRRSPRRLNDVISPDLLGNVVYGIKGRRTVFRVFLRTWRVQHRSDPQVLSRIDPPIQSL